MIKNYTIYFSGVSQFLFWFLVNNFKKKEVECDMKKEVDFIFDFKSDVYEGSGYKLKGVLKFMPRYLFPFLVLLFIFSSFISKVDDFYVLALLIGIFTAFSVSYRDFDIRVILGSSAFVILFLSFFYFGDFYSVGMMLMLAPKFFLFTFLLLRVFYDVKENSNKRLFYLPSPKIFFYTHA